MRYGEPVAVYLKVGGSAWHSQTIPGHEDLLALEKKQSDCTRQCDPAY